MWLPGPGDRRSRRRPSRRSARGNWVRSAGSSSGCAFRIGAKLPEEAGASDLAHDPARPARGIPCGSRRAGPRSSEGETGDGSRAPGSPSSSASSTNFWKAEGGFEEARGLLLGGQDRRDDLQHLRSRGVAPLRHGSSRSGPWTPARSARLDAHRLVPGSLDRGLGVPVRSERSTTDSPVSRQAASSSTVVETKARDAPLDLASAGIRGARSTHTLVARESWTYSMCASPRSARGGPGTGECP